jgi:hypothetical protein
MARRRTGRGGGAAIFALALLSACAALPELPDLPELPGLGGGGTAAGADDALDLRFEDVLAPEAYLREGPARVDTGEAAGFWAIVPGLPRPERALVENLATGATAEVALFRGPASGGIRLSAAAAEALGIGAGPAEVRVTALRSMPRIAAP